MLYTKLCVGMGIIALSQMLSISSGVEFLQTDCQKECSSCNNVHSKMLCIRDCPGKGPSSNQIIQCIRTQPKINSAVEANDNGSANYTGLRWTIFQKMPNLRYYFGGGNPKQLEGKEIPTANEITQLFVSCEQLREPCAQVIHDIKSSTSALRRHNPFGTTGAKLKQLESNLKIMDQVIAEVKQKGTQMTRQDLLMLTDGKFNLAAKNCSTLGASVLYQVKNPLSK